MHSFDPIMQSYDSLDLLTGAIAPSLLALNTARVRYKSHQPRPRTQDFNGVDEGVTKASFCLGQYIMWILSFVTDSHNLSRINQSPGDQSIFLLSIS